MSTSDKSIPSTSIYLSEGEVGWLPATHSHLLLQPSEEAGSPMHALVAARSGLALKGYSLRLVAIPEGGASKGRLSRAWEVNLETGRTRKVPTHALSSNERYLRREEKRAEQRARHRGKTPLGAGGGAEKVTTANRPTVAEQLVFCFEDLPDEGYRFKLTLCYREPHGSDRTQDVLFDNVATVPRHTDIGAQVAAKLIPVRFMECKPEEQKPEDRTSAKQKSRQQASPDEPASNEEKPLPASIAAGAPEATDEPPAGAAPENTMDTVSVTAKHDGSIDPDPQAIPAPRPAVPRIPEPTNPHESSAEMVRNRWIYLFQVQVASAQNEAFPDRAFSSRSGVEAREYRADDTGRYRRTDIGEPVGSNEPPSGKRQALLLPLVDELNAADGPGAETPRYYAWTSPVRLSAGQIEKLSQEVRKANDEGKEPFLTPVWFDRARLDRSGARPVQPANMDGTPIDGRNHARKSAEKEYRTWEIFPVDYLDLAERLAERYRKRLRLFEEWKQKAALARQLVGYGREILAARPELENELAAPDEKAPPRSEVQEEKQPTYPGAPDPLSLAPPDALEVGYWSQPVEPWNAVRAWERSYWKQRKRLSDQMEKAACELVRCLRHEGFRFTLESYDRAKSEERCAEGRRRFYDIIEGLSRSAAGQDYLTEAYAQTRMAQHANELQQQVTAAEKVQEKMPSGQRSVRLEAARSQPFETIFADADALEEELSYLGTALKIGRKTVQNAYKLHAELAGIVAKVHGAQSFASAYIGGAFTLMARSEPVGRDDLKALRTGEGLVAEQWLNIEEMDVRKRDFFPDSANASSQRKMYYRLQFRDKFDREVGAWQSELLDKQRAVLGTLAAMNTLLKVGALTETKNWADRERYEAVHAVAEVTAIAAEEIAESSRRLASGLARGWTRVARYALGPVGIGLALWKLGEDLGKGQLGLAVAGALEVVGEVAFFMAEVGIAGFGAGATAGGMTVGIAAGLTFSALSLLVLGGLLIYQHYRARADDKLLQFISERYLWGTDYPHAAHRETAAQLVRDGGETVDVPNGFRKALKDQITDFLETLYGFELQVGRVAPRRGHTRRRHPLVWLTDMMALPKQGYLRVTFEVMHPGGQGPAFRSEIRYRAELLDKSVEVRRQLMDVQPAAVYHADYTARQTTRVRRQIEPGTPRETRWEDLHSSEGSFEGPLGFFFYPIYATGGQMTDPGQAQRFNGQVESGVETLSDTWGAAGVRVVSRSSRVEPFVRGDGPARKPRRIRCRVELHLESGRCAFAQQREYTVPEGWQSGSEQFPLVQIPLGSRAGKR